jgi:DNA-binding NtrC family response regulator
VFDSGEFRRLGGTSVIKVDVRIIAATNKNLMAMVADGRFREDLYFRIAGVKVHIPPLRERRMDIPALVEVLIKRMCDRDKAERCHISKEAMERLMGYGFPGNVRELLNILQQALALSPDGVITAEHIRLDERLSFDRAHRSENTAVLTQSPPQKREVHRHHHNLRAAAKALGVSERTLYRKIKRYRLNYREAVVE